MTVDNGSPFASAAREAWARGAGTLVLYSPPACPRYNGSIEASIGAISTRAHQAAAAHGHPEYWTTDDVEVARTDANLVRRLHHGVATSAVVRWRGAPSIAGRALGASGREAAAHAAMVVRAPLRGRHGCRRRCARG